MRLVIFGSRDVRLSFELVDYAFSIALAHWSLEEWPDDLSVVSGCAPGADRCGELWAARRGYPIHPFPADWSHYGRRAGFIRNRAMAEFATHGLGFWRDESSGTANMTTWMTILRKPVLVQEIK